MAIRKITVHIPDDLLRSAQKSSGQGVTETVRQGLRLVAAGETYRQLARLRGAVKFSVNVQRLSELLSEPSLTPRVRGLLTALPQLQIEPGYWERAGLLRAAVIKGRRKARVADALIAQSCLDQLTPLVTRDKDFRHFARAAGLALL